MKYLPLIAILILAGCSITDVEMEERMYYSDKIEREFWIFVNDCTMTGGQLHVPRKRVQNAPPTVWEMKKAVCYYDDDTLPRKMDD